MSRDRTFSGMETRFVVTTLYRLAKLRMLATFVAVGLRAAIRLCLIVATAAIVRALAPEQELGGDELLAPVVAVIGFFVLDHVIGAFESIGIGALGLSLQTALREGELQRLLAPPRLDHLDDARNADWTRAVMAGGAGIPATDVTRGLADTIRSTIEGAGVAALVIMILGPLAGTALVGFWVLARFAVRRSLLESLDKWTSDPFQSQKLGYLNHLLVDGRNADEMKLFRLRPFFLEKVLSIWRSRMERLTRSSTDTSRRVLLLGTTGFIVNGVVLGYAGLIAATGSIGLSDLAVVLLSVLRLSRLMAVDETHLRSTQARRLLDRPSDLEATEGELASLGQDRRATSSTPVWTDTSNSIAFDRVWFRYNRTQEWVLRDLSFEVRAGASLGIQGPNGVGKTTILQLLAGMVVPDRGTIYVGGRALADIPANVLRARVAAVFQDFARFRCTVRDEIGFGAPDRCHLSDEMLSIATKAGVGGLVRSLPSGWDTELLANLEGGVDLSVGEWQRLALARALFALNTGRDILLLDEPTSHFDAEMESRFASLVAQLTGVTRVIVSHRPGIHKWVDGVLTLPSGHAVAHDRSSERDAPPLSCQS